MQYVRVGLGRWLAPVFVMMAVLAGCGPVESTAVISDASVALAGAKTAEGQKYAPFEYTSAELYLKKAREERGYADYEVAIDYARKARDFARQAQAKSLKRVREGAENAGSAFAPGGSLDSPLGVPGTIEDLTPPPPAVSSLRRDSSEQVMHAFYLVRRSILLAVCGSLMIASGCVTGDQIRVSGGVVEQDLKLARKQNAMKCAPKELATGEAELTFALGELDQGNWVRAKQHMDASTDAAKQAVQLSKGCVKKVHIKAAAPPPVIVKIEEKDTDNDGFLDKDDKCPEDPEDKDGFEDDDGCPEPDNDGDGVLDAEDRCPVVAGPVENQGCPLEAPLDTDGDGLTDDVDKCPTQPEDKDQFQDEDGCPDPDNDQDTVLDADDGCPVDAGPVENKGCPLHDKDGDGITDDKDKCPDEPEDKDNFEDADGCPDLDNDADGIPDIKDRCPMDPGIPETEGCPPKDRDGDQVYDHEDKCPDEPGVKEEQGCPRKYTLVELKKDKIEIKQKVFFRSGKWSILARSFELLNQVSGVLRDNPKIKIRIEGHTDSRGSDSYNLRLSQHRANSVRDYLTGQGVDGSRLESAGFGETRPIASNATSMGREQNRRVEFFITDQ